MLSPCIRDNSKTGSRGLIDRVKPQTRTVSFSLMEFDIFKLAFTVWASAQSHWVVNGWIYPVWATYSPLLSSSSRGIILCLTFHETNGLTRLWTLVSSPGYFPGAIRLSWSQLSIPVVMWYFPHQPCGTFPTSHGITRWSSEFNLNIQKTGPLSSCPHRE